MSPRVGFARGLAGHPDGLPDLPLAWIEGLLEARLVETAEATDWQDISCWPEGRLFGAAGEYRWRRGESGGLHAVMLLEDGPLPEPFEAGPELESLGDREVHLWGQWAGPAGDPRAGSATGAWFYAPELPTAMAYPVDLGTPPHNGKEAVVRVRRYRDRSGGQGEFLRLVDVKAVPAAKESGDA